MSVSREEGYRRSEGKEVKGIELARDFVQQILACDPVDIVDAEENYRLGDLRLPNGTVEVKTQPIDPGKYRKKNFVEVFELTGKSRHAGGAQALCKLLGLQLSDLEGARVADRRRAVAPADQQRALGAVDAMSVSITSMAASACTLYANPDNPVAFIYTYRPEELLAYIRGAVLRDGLLRGAGNSNDVTFAVLVPLSAAVWVRDRGKWSHHPASSENDSASLAWLRSLAQ